MMRETAKRLSLRLNGSEYAHLKVLAEGCGMKLEPKPSVREKVKALKAEVEAARRREPIIPLKENDLVK